MELQWPVIVNLIIILPALVLGLYALVKLPPDSRKFKRFTGLAAWAAIGLGCFWLGRMVYMYCSLGYRI